MTLEELLALNPQQLDKLPRADIRRLQRHLQERGLYRGRIDGRSGALTKSAIEEHKRGAFTRRDQKIREMELSIEAQQLKAAGEKARRDAEAAGRGAAEKAQKEIDAESYTGIARTVGSNLVSPLAGYAMGRSLGSGINTLADISQTRRNESLAQAAKKRLQGLTTREGARIGAERAGAMPSRRGLPRIGGRMLPHLIVGLGMAGKGAAIEALTDPDDPLATRELNRASALGLGGAGLGILEKGAQYAISPTVSPNAGDISVIESNNLRRAAALKSPEADFQAQVNDLKANKKLPQLKAEAKRLGLNPRGNKTELAERIARHSTEEIATPAKQGRIAKALGKATKAFPPVAGGLAAYDMATSQAQAAGLSETGSTAAGAGAAVAGAGAGYGVQKGAEYVGQAASKIPYVGEALGAVGRAATGLPGVLGYGGYLVGSEMYDDPGKVQRKQAIEEKFRQPGGVSAEASRMATPESEPGDADVARAWQQSPRQTVIELVRQGLDADDIGMLAGVSVEDVESVVEAIPPQAMQVPQSARSPERFGLDF